MTSIDVLGLPAKIHDALLKANLDTVEDFLLNAPLDGDHIQEPQSTSRSKRKSFTGSILTPAQQIALRSLSAAELESTYDQASAYICQGVTIGNGRDLLQDQSWLTLGDPLLDETLGGGIMTRSITEIVGESSAGKTQFCLQLCLTVQLPRHLGGLDGSVVWLSTEGKFAYTRLEAMIPSFMEKYQDAGTDLTPEVIRDNIYFDAMADQETQLHIFNYQLPILIQDTHLLADEQENLTQATETMDTTASPPSPIISSVGNKEQLEEQQGVRRKPIRLVIVDSIANNFRSQMDMRPAEVASDTVTVSGQSGNLDSGGSLKGSLIQRSADLCETGIRLRTLADQFSLAVVCVNQVSDVFESADDPSSTELETAAPSSLATSTTMGLAGSSATGVMPPLPRHRWSHAMRKLKPALGLVWENTINTRILLERTQPTFLSSSLSSALAQIQDPLPPPPDCQPDILQAYTRECERIQEQRERALARQEPIRVMSVLFSPWTSTDGAWCRYSIQSGGVIGVKDDERDK